MAAKREAKIIGVTGLPGSGKSTVAKIAAECDDGEGKIIDADKIGHAALMQPEIIARLRKFFPAEIFAAASEQTAQAEQIDRRKLGALVFANPQKLRDLESVVHPWIKTKILADIADFRAASRIIIDAPLLKNLQIDHLFAGVFLVIAPKEQRLARVQKRGWNAEELHRRDLQARLYDDKNPLVKVIANDQDLNALAQTVTAAIAKMSQ